MFELMTAMIGDGASLVARPVEVRRRSLAGAVRRIARRALIAAERTRPNGRDMTAHEAAMHTWMLMSA